MSAARTREVQGLRVGLIDTSDDAADLGDVDVVVCGDPATLRAARALLRRSPKLIALHDAGVGKDRAGVAGLERLADVGIAAVAVSHDSARIGDADDVLAGGVVEHLNAPARGLGLEAGPLTVALSRLAERLANERLANERRGDERVA